MKSSLPFIKDRLRHAALKQQAQVTLILKQILVRRKCLREQFIIGVGEKEAGSVMSGRETDPRFLGIG
jgi:hypothetical protein